MIANKKIQLAKYGSVAVAALLCLLGTALIAVPDLSVPMLRRYGGLLLILFGCIKLIGYLSGDLYRLAFQYDLACGILLPVLGILLLVRTDTMMPLIFLLFGMYILADALLKVQISVDAKRFGLSAWWVILTAAVVTGIVGLLLMFCPYEHLQTGIFLLGLTLLAEGILTIITMMTAVSIRRCTDADD